MKRCSFCEWIPILPWPVWPLAEQCSLGQNVVVGSMLVLQVALGNVPRGVCLDPRLHYKCTSPRLPAELPTAHQRRLFHPSQLRPPPRLDPAPVSGPQTPSGISEGALSLLPPALCLSTAGRCPRPILRPASPPHLLRVSGLRQVSGLARKQARLPLPVRRHAAPPPSSL